MTDDQLQFTATAYLKNRDGEVMFPIAGIRLTDAEMIDESRTLKLTGEDYPLLIGNANLRT
jgi:hypothetical protein